MYTESDLGRDGKRSRKSLKERRGADRPHSTDRPGWCPAPYMFPLSHRVSSDGLLSAGRGLQRLSASAGGDVADGGFPWDRRGLLCVHGQSSGHRTTVCRSVVVAAVIVTAAHASVGTHPRLL